MTIASRIQAMGPLEQIFAESATPKAPRLRSNGTAISQFEIIGIADDHCVITFRTRPDAVIRVRAVSLESKHTPIDVHSQGAVSRIDPDHAYHWVCVSGLTPRSQHVVQLRHGSGGGPVRTKQFATLPAVGGAPVARIATVNDLHFGEHETGRLRELEAIPLLTRMPVLRRFVEPVRLADGARSYPNLMNGAAVVEINAWNPDLVIAKGDLTHSGGEAQLAEFHATYAPLADRLLAFRGNHDAGPSGGLPGADVVRDIPGARIVVLDTVDPGHTRGRITHEQVEWVRATAAASTVPVLLFGHHNLFTHRAGVGPHGSFFYGVDPIDSYRLLRVIDDCPAIVGYFSGHSHRNRISRGPRGVPIVETASVKEFPATWAAYTITEGGLMQTQYPLRNPDALAWSAKTRSMYMGLAPHLARGRTTDRACALEFGPGHAR